MQTVLDTVTPRDLRHEPFPHVCRRGTIDVNLCSELIARYPSLGVAAGEYATRNNFRYNISACRVLENPALVGEVWHDFIQAHASQAFLDRLLGIFGSAIAEAYPHLGCAAGALPALRAGVRNIDTFSTCDVLLDVQIAGNTPVLTPSSTRSCHVDDPRKLFAGLFYLRLAEDRSHGGQLQMWKPRREDRIRFHNGVYVRPRRRTLACEIPYERNALVLFLNTPRSWHGVGVRSRTPFPRLFVNVVGEVKEPLFDIKQYRDRWDHFLTKHGLRTYHEETPYFA